MISPYAISFLTITFLIAFYLSKFSNTTKLVLYAILSLETIAVLSFFTDPKEGLGKYPFSAALPVFFVSGFLAFRIISSDRTVFNQSFKPVTFMPSYTSHFFFYGFILILVTVFLEFFIFDGTFRSNSISLIFLGIFLIFYERISNQYYELKLMGLIFLLCFCTVFPLTTVLIQFATDDLGGPLQMSHRDTIVYWTLGKPLTNLLTILGFEVWSAGDTIYYIDSTIGRSSSVSVSEGCSGIMSVLIFFCALFSYLAVEYRKINLLTVILFVIGATMSYFANLLRMGIIIIAGHYYGNPALEWTHANVGWLIFTIWLFLFWKFMVWVLFDINYKNTNT